MKKNNCAWVKRMIKDALNNEQINTDVISSLKGLGFQKVRAAERLLRALMEGKKAVLCTIEPIDDVLEVDVDGEKVNYPDELEYGYGQQHKYPQVSEPRERD